MRTPPATTRIRRKRAAARLSVTVSFLILAAEVILFTALHRSPPLAVSTVAAALLGIAGGLTYLRSTRGQQ